MQLYCPACQAAFAAQSHCPKCGARLLSPQESFITNARGKAPPPDTVPPTFSSRVAVGVIIAVGLILGLRECTSVLALAQSEPVSESWESSNSDPATFAIRLFAVLAGGLIAGAGRRGGIQVGFSVGAFIAVLLTGIDLYAAGQVTNRSAVLLALAYPTIAALAGATGAWLWPADADLPEPKHVSSHGSSMARLAVDDAVRRQTRPTAWFRIAIAATIIVAGVMATDSIRYGLFKGSAGWLNTGGVNRSATIGFQIATILTLIGGLIAGMGTNSGLKHGLFAGLLAGLGLMISSTSRVNGLFPAIEGYLNFFDFDLDPLTSPRIAIKVMIGLLALTCCGGWLGGQLFPPLAPRNLWNRKMQRQT